MLSFCWSTGLRCHTHKHKYRERRGEEQGKEWEGGSGESDGYPCYPIAEHLRVRPRHIESLRRLNTCALSAASNPARYNRERVRVRERASERRNVRKKAKSGPRTRARGPESAQARERKGAAFGRNASHEQTGACTGELRPASQGRPFPSAPFYQRPHFPDSLPASSAECRVTSCAGFRQNEARLGPSQSLTCNNELKHSPIRRPRVYR